jgi:hypothetical protein
VFHCVQTMPHVWTLSVLQSALDGSKRLALRPGRFAPGIHCSWDSAVGIATGYAFYLWVLHPVAYISIQLVLCFSYSVSENGK